MVLTGLRKNLVVKEILATGIIRSMRKVLADTQKQVQPYLVTEKVLTVEVNLFHCQTENSSYLHQHQLFIRIYQKERSEERRVGKECRNRSWLDRQKKRSEMYVDDPR